MKSGIHNIWIYLSVIIATSVFNPVTGLSTSKPNKNDTTTINSNNTISATGDVTIINENNGVTSKQLSERDMRQNAKMDKRFAEIKREIADQKWQAIKNDPFFKNFALNKYGKELDQLNTSAMATFWQDISGYLSEAKRIDANYQQVTQGIVSKDLKALIAQIDKAREDFNYSEENHLLQVFEEKHSSLAHDTAKFFYLKAQNFELQINYPEAERYYRKAAAIEDQDPFYLDAHATILQKMGQYADAEPLFRRALAIDEKALGKDHPDVASSLNNLALLLYSQGKYGEAEPLYRRALGIYEKKLGTDHPWVATGLNNLALLLYSQGKYGEAEPLYRRALAIYEKADGSYHPDVATSLSNLAELLRAEGKYADAEPLYRRALAIREKALGPDHPDVAKSLNNLAALLDSQGKYAATEPLFRRALAIDEKALGKDHPTTVGIRKNLNSLHK